MEDQDWKGRGEGRAVKQYGHLRCLGNLLSHGLYLFRFRIGGFFYIEKPGQGRFKVNGDI